MYGAADAEDLTQAFFARLIETRGFAAAEPERGRSRSYLLGALKHCLSHWMAPVGFAPQTSGKYPSFAELTIIDADRILPPVERTSLSYSKAFLLAVEIRQRVQ